MYKKKLRWKVNKNGCWICISHAKDKDGYCVFQRNKKWYRIHRYMYEQKYGILKRGEFVGHKCKNPDCINPKHLFKGDMKKIIQEGNLRNNERTWGKKLTKKNVIKIFKDRLTPKKILAERYGVKKNAIWNIHSGRGWIKVTSKIELKQTPEWLKKYKEKKKKKYDKNYRKKNRKDINGKIRKWKLMKYKTDKSYNLSRKLKWSVNNAFKKYTQTGKIFSSSEYGIDYKAIIRYLEPIPKDYLTSKGKYEIHHIKPLHTFNLVHKDGSTNLKEVQKAFSPKNHQLLTIKEHKEIHRKLNRKRKDETNI